MAGENRYNESVASTAARVLRIESGGKICTLTNVEGVTVKALRDINPITSYSDSNGNKVLVFHFTDNTEHEELISGGSGGITTFGTNAGEVIPFAEGNSTEIIPGNRIDSISRQAGGEPLKVWSGIKSEYDNLTIVDDDTVYYTTDETESFVDAVSRSPLGDSTIPVHFWTGTQTMYDALGVWDDNTLYYVDEPTT